MQYFGVHDLTVHLVHYFDRTGTSYADDQTIRDNFAVWLETVEGAVQHIQEYSKGAPIGLFGHSLGGFLSAATLIRNLAVRAGVILSGGLDEESARAVKRTAPTLILHGSADVRVPLAEAQRLEAALIAAGARPEMRVYSGEGHTLELASYADALDRATRFLREHLA
jgi:dipeptidyl aminopeptidase/acylaminoacyl peptidase